MENEKMMIEVEVDAKDYEATVAMLQKQGLNIVEQHEAEDEEMTPEDRELGEGAANQFRAMKGL